MIKIAVACDHAGVELKNLIIKHLSDKGLPVIDCGTNDASSVDYADYAVKVCKTVIEDNARGILICGTGIGMSIAANKIKGIRAALCFNEFMAGVTRLHNDANVICIGARTTDSDLAVKMVDVFLDTAFEGGRHAVRVGKITDLEK